MKKSDKELEIIEQIKNFGDCNNNLRAYEMFNVVIFFSQKQFEEISFSEEHKRYTSKKVEDYHNQISLAIERLMKDNNSRQAVISFDISSHIPNCMLSIQLQIRNNELICTCYQRSLDMFEKFPQDILICNKIVERFFEASNIRLETSYTFFVGNLHFYS